MRLLRLHIENFGCLSNFDLELQEGLNVLLQENGWGKSTLAAFLRAMFYGLEGERKKGYFENDRLRYKPWNGGHFGGSLEFEAGGKRYLVTRGFGEKDKNGFFRLQDATTFLDSSDYSERLGEELFGIDRESFERTSFIDGASLRYRGINSAIGAMVGTASPTDDFSNYDAAQERLKNYLNANSPKKRTGELYKLWEEIQELTRETGNQDLVEARIDAALRQQEQEKEKQKALKEKRELLQKEQAGLVRERTKLMNANRSKELKEETERRREAVRALERDFGGSIPTREELRALNEKVQKARENDLRLSGYEDGNDRERYLRLKEYFRNGVPDEGEMQAQIKTRNEVQDLLQRAVHLETQEKKEALKLEEYVAERGRIETAQGLERARRAKEKGRLKILGITLLFLGLLVGALVPILHGNALLFLPAAILMAVGALVLFSPYVRGMAKEDTPIGEADLLLRQERQARENLESVEREREDVQERIQAAEKDISRFLQRYGFSYRRETSENLLYEMKNKAAEYLELCREIKEKEHARRELEVAAEKQRSEISADLKRLQIPVDFKDEEGIKNWVDNTMQRLTTYEKEQGEVTAAISAENAFLREHPELEAMDGELPSEDALQRREREIEDRLAELSQEETKTYENLSAYRCSLDEAYENAENLRVKGERLESLKERWKIEEGKYRIVEKTQDYLRTAKEQFTALFMQPIKTSFDRYYELMTGRENAGDEFQLDANLNLFRKEEGRFHDVEAQSSGYADVIGLCIRVSLLDVMYGKEKPLVIMDDPFTNLDEKHLLGAKKFMKEISEYYQILYLTCHETRNVS